MSKAVPIPIQKRTSSSSTNKPITSSRNVSASMPIAPVIGSLPPPSQLSLDMPDLSLPPSTPEALSIAEVATAETTQRLVGVSSAPALSYIEQARRKGYPGTSPTVLSLLQIKGTDDTILQNKQLNTTNSSASASPFTKSIPDINNNQQNSGLSAMFKGRTSNNNNDLTMLNTNLNNLHLQSTNNVPYTASSSLPKTTISGSMVLATSFRDPANMPPPLPEDLEGEEDEISSDDDDVMVARRRAIANHTYNNTNPSMVSSVIHQRNTNRVNEEDDEDDDDDEHMNPQQGRQHSTNDDEVFESDL